MGKGDVEEFAQLDGRCFLVLSLRRAWRCESSQSMEMEGAQHSNAVRPATESYNLLDDSWWLKVAAKVSAATKRVTKAAIRG